MCLFFWTMQQHTRKTSKMYKFFYRKSINFALFFFKMECIHEKFLLLEATDGMCTLILQLCWTCTKHGSIDCFGCCCCFQTVSRIILEILFRGKMLKMSVEVAASYAHTHTETWTRSQSLASLNHCRHHHHPKIMLINIYYMRNWAKEKKRRPKECDQPKYDHNSNIIGPNVFTA